MSADYNEEAYENALIELFQNMRWEYVYGPEVERDWHSPRRAERLPEGKASL